MGDLFNEAARQGLNWYAIVGAGVAAFVVGGIWYSKAVFGTKWMALNGVTDAEAKQANVPMIMGSALVLTILTAYCVARLMLIGGGWQGGARVGLFVGAAVAFGTGINYLFEQKKLALFVVNGGHQLVTCVLMGAILGQFR